MSFEDFFFFSPPIFCITSPFEIRCHGLEAACAPQPRQKADPSATPHQRDLRRDWTTALVALFRAQKVPAMPDQGDNGNVDSKDLI